MILSQSRRLRRWGATRRQGMHRFIVLNGVLGYGLVTAGVWSLCTWGFSDGFAAAVNLPVALTVFPVVGALVAWRGWHDAERRYQASQDVLGAAT